MKYYLFLLSILSIVYLSKAGPLRLQKRAAFYIANETACVVDNIVYSSGDPIPTDDPCEACKCRPPGFACVLKECKVKQGCRAIRHVGHCCPEYVCGCEHNGKWYNDGEQIIDERNPCYECHCLGTSIACAFADCNFRLDCVPIYVPGKCCPDYTNCSRDNPEITPVIGDNALPPANLLPELYESVLPETLPADEVAETAEQSQASTSKPESSDIPVVKESISDPEIVGKSPEVEDGIKDIQSEKEEPKEDNTEKTDEEPHVLLNSESEIKKVDEAEVTTVKEVIEDKLTESIDNRSEASTDSVPELREEEPIITTETDKVVESEAEETSEKHVEIAVTSTISPATESPVKNSASQNSKSLKILEDQTSEELVEKIELIKEEAPLQIKGGENEAVTSVSEEKIPSKVETDDAVVPTKAESEAVENIAEESSNDHPSIALYSNDDKVIKKESAETVTIVVHVREKSKPPTEAEEKVTEVYLTSEKPEEISVKSNDNIKSEINIESTEVEEAASTGKNFEVFPNSTEINNVELSTSISKDPEEKIEARSESDSVDLDAEEKPVNEEESDSKSKVDPPVTETKLIDSEEGSEVANEAREGEIIEEIKEKEKKVEEDSKVTEKPVEDLKVTEKQGEDLKVTEISEEQKVTEKPENGLKVTEITVEQPNIALKIKLITDYEEETPKIEEFEVKEDKEQNKPDIKEIKPVTEETKPNVEEPKPEEIAESRSDEIIEEAKEENTEEIVEELNSVKVGEIKTGEISETKPEEKRVEEEKEESKSEVVEESKSEEKVEEFKLEEKVEESKSGEIEESKSEEVEESKSEERIVENKAEEKLEETKQEGKTEVTEVESVSLEEKPEGEKSEEAKDQESVESNQPEEPKDSE